MRRLQNILVIHGNLIGDVILSTPILKRLKELYPESNITFLIRPEARELVEGLPFIDKVIAYRKGDSIYGVVQKIWKYDIALCLDFKYRSALLPFLARIPIRAGLRHKRGILLTHPVERDPWQERIYEPYNFANIIRRTVGIDLGNSLDQLFIGPATSACKEKVNALFRDLAFNKNNLIISIAPYSSTRKKDWPLDKYIGLVSLLKANYSCQVIVLGGAKDAGKANFEGGHDLVGRTSLMETAEILRRSHLFVGNCSGPLHIAAAAGTPIVALYGSTSADHWAPRKNAIILKKEIDCSPCDGRKNICTDYPCMQAIEVKDVFAACERMIHSNYPRHRDEG